jgi:hypothetical protein
MGSPMVTAENSHRDDPRRRLLRMTSRTLGDESKQCAWCERRHPHSGQPHGSRRRGHLCPPACSRPANIRGRPGQDPRRRSGAPLVVHRDVPPADHGRNTNVCNVAIIRRLSLRDSCDARRAEFARSGSSVGRGPGVASPDGRPPRRVERGCLLTALPRNRWNEAQTAGRQAPNASATLFRRRERYAS